MVRAIAEVDHCKRLVGRQGICRDLGNQRDVLARGQAGNQVVELEYETDVFTSITGEHRLPEGTEIVVFIVHRAAGGHIQATEDIQQRGFTAARCSQQNDELTPIQFQVDAAQGVNLHFTHLVDLGDTAGIENGILTSYHWVGNCH